jgi:hypothetical protein
MARTFTSIFKFLVPRWLSNGDGGKVIKSLTTVLDESQDRLRAGLVARFPSYAEDDALYLIGRNRKIPRGRSEVSSHYAQRLIRWRYPRGHRTRGSAFALLEQISEYFGGDVTSWSVDVNKNYHVRAADGTESFQYGVPWVWDSDPRRARFWCAITPRATLTSPQPDLGNPALWGGAFGTPGYSIGQQNITPDDADAIRNLFAKPSPWKPSGSLPMWFIVDFSGVVPPGASAVWVHWSYVSGGVRLPARSADQRFWALNSEVNNYTPNPDNACVLLPLVAGGTYAANPAAAAATIHHRNGTTYTPNPDNAKARVLLIDDASAP